ncbi:MAG: hypothetical protein ACYSR6_13925, partial [Planctomycetota bacterium]
FGATAVFGGLIFMLLRNQLTEARAERSEWLKTIREQNDATRNLSEVLVEIRTILKEKTK